MKKMLGAFWVLISITLTGCSSTVTTDDLKSNDWLVQQTTDKKDEPDLIASFTDHVMTMSIDANSMESTATNEWEKMGEEFGKALVEQMTFKLEYELNGNEIKIQDADNEKEYIYFEVSKENDKIILEPIKDKNKDNDATKLTLSPFKKKKTDTSKTKESTTVSSTMTSAEKEKKAAEEAKQSYQSILDNYAKKIKDAVPKLVEEYKTEAANSTSGIDGLAELSNNKIQELAKISNDGIQKMAEIHLKSGSGKYSEYEEWANKLTDIYMKESEAITNAYMESAMNLSYNDSEETPQDYNNYNGESPANNHETKENAQAQQQTQEKPKEEPASEQYITAQNGEGPNQIAARAGISVDQLYELNGIDPDNFLLYPGMQLRIK